MVKTKINSRKNKSFREKKSLKKNLKRNKTLMKNNRCNIKIRGGSTYGSPPPPPSKSASKPRPQPPKETPPPDILHQQNKKLMDKIKELKKLLKLSDKDKADLTKKVESLEKIIEEHISDEISGDAVMSKPVIDKYGHTLDDNTFSNILEMAIKNRNDCEEGCERRRRGRSAEVQEECVTKCSNDHEPKSPYTQGSYDYNENFTENYAIKGVIDKWCKLNPENADCTPESVVGEFPLLTLERSKVSAPIISSEYVPPRRSPSRSRSRSHSRSRGSDSSSQSSSSSRSRSRSRNSGRRRRSSSVERILENYRRRGDNQGDSNSRSRSRRGR